MLASIIIPTFNRVDLLTQRSLESALTQNFEDYEAPPTSQKIISMDWGWLFKKEVFDNLQYDEALRANDDTDFGIQYLKKYSYLDIDSPLRIAFDIEDEKKSLSFPDASEIAGMRLFL